MRRRIGQNFGCTVAASYVGYITQAIVNNFAPLLFLTFVSDFGVTFDRLAFLINMNFGVQLLVDLVSARYVDRIGYRACIVTAHVMSAMGLVGMAVLPDLLWDPYAGLLAAAAVYAVGGGLIEVLISPIVEACPTKNKEAVMSLLHSFYCWGQVGVVLLSTLFFSLAGIQNWRILAYLWAVLPACNAVFFLFVPIRGLVEDGDGMPVGDLVGQKLFWLFALLMVCAGASELGMSQWVSAFAESGLKVSKTVGDLAGPCAFAVFMGSARALYARFADRISLKKCMALCAALCAASYLLASLSPNPLLALFGCALCGLSVGIMWPGTFSMAAKAIPRGGTAMFAFLALFGDVGCNIGPGLVGLVSAAEGGELKRGLLSATLYPAILLAGLLAGRGALRRQRAVRKTHVD
ncbi:MAG TPA: MFS transporter [Candidatus Eisenbergiella merdigallinarum]|uniref:MFS transporter n=1 Tax=Candidatus Eisenbergiella merdigallinarum TaxID=2838552 RepID=A0A9D2MS08_9FIRM|nr:MFS transporter [Candidatus Eisenbergiella merdigallinarum]